MTAPARRAAIRALERVAEEGAYAAAALDAEIGRGRLDLRDAALATEIVYGTLRVLPALDARIAERLRRPGRLDRVLRAALRAGAYQLAHLGRVPAHAAVSGSVDWVRERRGVKLAGVANAVLRRLAEARPASPAPPTAQVVPQWLAETLEASVGAERARAFLVARRLPPATGLRVAATADPAATLARLREVRPDAEVRPGDLAPRAILVRGAGDPRRLPGYARGALTVQEEGAQLVGLAVGAGPGERILDACAGRGGKTAQLVEAVGEVGAVVATDPHEAKLERLAEELRRLRLPPVEDARPVDLTVGAGGLPEGTFDAVLVDAPCTGLGTVHRRPELLLRVGPGDPERLAALQGAILGTAWRLVRPGGRLVYAVCSPTRAEGADVADAFEAAHPDARRVPAGVPAAPGVAPDPDGILRVGPWSAAADAPGPDAYQVVRWRRAAAD